MEIGAGAWPRLLSANSWPWPQQLEAGMHRVHPMHTPAHLDRAALDLLHIQQHGHVPLLLDHYWVNIWEVRGRDTHHLNCSRETT